LVDQKRTDTIIHINTAERKRQREDNTAAEKKRQREEGGTGSSHSHAHTRAKIQNPPKDVAGSFDPSGSSTGYGSSMAGLGGAGKTHYRYQQNLPILTLLLPYKCKTLGLP